MEKKLKNYEVSVEVYFNGDMSRCPYEDVWEIKAHSKKDAKNIAETSTEFSSLSDTVKVIGIEEI